MVVDADFVRRALRAAFDPTRRRRQVIESVACLDAAMQEGWEDVSLLCAHIAQSMEEEAIWAAMATERLRRMGEGAWAGFGERRLCAPRSPRRAAFSSAGAMDRRYRSAPRGARASRGCATPAPTIAVEGGRRARPLPPLLHRRAGRRHPSTTSASPIRSTSRRWASLCAAPATRASRRCGSKAQKPPLSRRHEPPSPEQPMATDVVRSVSGACSLAPPTAARSSSGTPPQDGPHPVWR